MKGVYLASPRQLTLKDAGEATGVFVDADHGAKFDDFLSQLDGKLRFRNEAISQRLEAWGNLLELAGWCVALEMSGGTPWLNGLARHHLELMSRTAATWEDLVTILEILPDATIHRQNGGVLVWSAVFPETYGVGPTASLTRRETEVMTWLRRGKASPEIAVILGCSARTVEKHVANLYRKIGVRDRTAAIWCNS